VRLKHAVYCVLLLTWLAVATTKTAASPMLVRLGNAQVVLALSPDPPVVGAVRATLHVSGVPTSILSRTAIRFRAEMPSMGMSGPSGFVRRSGVPGNYVFNLALQMAAPYAVRLQFSGGLTGVVTYRFAVADDASNVSSMKNMSGMSNSSGNPEAWRNAVFALVALLLVGAIVLRKDRRPITLGLLVAAAFLVLFLAIGQSRYAAPAMDMSSMSRVQGTGATPVVLATVRSGESRTTISAPGTVQPYLTQDIVVRAAGILQNFNSYAGDHVRAGQIIATLDAAELGSQAQAAAADAQAQAAGARAAEIEAQHHAPVGLSIAQNEAVSVRTDLAAAIADQHAKAHQLSYWGHEISREQMLYSQGAVSQEELQSEQSQAAAARSAYEAAGQHVASLQQQVQAAQSKTTDARANIAMTEQQAQAAQAQASRAASSAQSAGTLAAYRTVVAPNDAVVLKRLVDPGVYVAAGTAILRIAVVDRLRIQANVAQEDRNGINIGTPIDARLPNGQVVHGRVSSMAPAADPATHTAPIEAIVSGTPSGIQPGGYVRVTLHEYGSTTEGLQVPSAALVGNGSEAAVWVDNDGSAHRSGVHVISDDGTTAIVKGDIRAGMRVVTDGAATLEEGQTIMEQHA